MTFCMGVVAMARSNTAQYRCLCPWFIRDGVRNIDCEACKGFGKEIRIIFDSEEEKNSVSIGIQDLMTLLLNTKNALMQSWPNICGIKAEHSLAYF